MRWRICRKKLQVKFFGRLEDEVPRVPEEAPAALEQSLFVHVRTKEPGPFRSTSRRDAPRSLPASDGPPRSEYALLPDVRPLNPKPEEEIER